MKRSGSLVCGLCVGYLGDFVPLWGSAYRNLNPVIVWRRWTEEFVVSSAGRF